jgi:succinyl-diaminopimelate desuccinylase
MSTEATLTRPFSIAPLVAHRLNETLLWLCSVASPIGDEEELCDRVLERVQKLALPANVRRVKNSLVVPIHRVARSAHAGDAPKPASIALVGHLDTVRTENGPARIDGDRCFGAGASDMKSGLALMLVYAEMLKPGDIACDLTLVFYSREEGPFAENELGSVLEEVRELHELDLAVCLEPSDNKLSLGCNGSIHATVTFEGRTAHSARPWEGDNAITKAASFLAELGAMRPIETTLDGLVFRTVTTVTQAHDGARGRNVVPDRFILNVNHRFSPNMALDTAQADVRALVADRATLEFTDLSPAAPPLAGHPLVKQLIAAGAMSVEPKQAWTDVARFFEHGISAVNFGPGENAQAHQRNESTSLTLLHEGYGILRRWLASAKLDADERG